MTIRRSDNDGQAVDDVRSPESEMIPPERTAEPRIDFACPQCRTRLASYHETCPSCGLPLGDYFSGQFHLRRGPVTKVVTWVILVLFGLCLIGLVAALIGSLAK